MKVKVFNNNIEKAIKDLKRKLSKEGFYAELKDRRFYDKPSVKKKKKALRAAQRHIKKGKKRAANRKTSGKKAPGKK